MEEQTSPNGQMRRMAHTIMFWLAVSYVAILVAAMTPYTHQLDDIKVVVLHAFGPVLTIAYLALLAMGLLDPPRRGLLITLGSYYATITISTLFAPPVARWIAWEGFWMQWALLGPFLAFMSCGGERRRIHHAVMFFALLTLVTSVCGLAHRGVLGQPGAPELIYQVYEKKINQLTSDASSKIRAYQTSPDPTQKQTLAAKINSINQDVRNLHGTYSFKIFSTLYGARSEMMSLILNRNFFACFLILMAPFAICSFFLVPPVSWRLVAGGAGVLGACAFLAEVGTATHFMSKMIPQYAMNLALLAALAPLALSAVTRLGSPALRWGVFCGAMLLAGLLGLAGSGSVLWSVLFLAVALPAAAASFLIVETTRPGRIAGGVALVAALTCLFAGQYHGALIVLITTLAATAIVRTPGLVWRLLAVATVMSSVLCIKYTRCKVSLFFVLEASVILMAFLALFPGKFNFGHPWRTLSIAISGLCIAVALFLVSPQGATLAAKINKEFVQEQIVDFGNPLQSRFVIWHGGWEIFKQHPILGAGLKSFLVFFPEARRPDYSLYEISHVTLSAHNFFLDLLAETGVVGFVTFMSFLIFLYWKCWGHIARSPDRGMRIITICAVGGMTGFLLSNITSPTSRWPIGAGNLWAALGFMAALVNRPVALEEQVALRAPWAPTPKVRTTLWVLCALSVLGWVWTTDYSIGYFKGAMANNNGLGEIGEPPKGAGPVFTYFEKLKTLRDQIAAPTASAEDKARLTEELKKTSQLYTESRDRAIDYFKDAIKWNPHFVTSYYKLASLYSMGDAEGARESDLRKALQTYEEMQKYTPEFSQVRFNLTILHSRLGNREEALENSRKSAHMTIRLPENQRLIGELLFRGRERTSWLIEENDILDAKALEKRLRKGHGPLSKQLYEEFQKASKVLVENGGKDLEKSDEFLRLALSKALSAAIEGDLLYSPERFAETPLSKRMLRRLEAGQDTTLRLNRSLLCELYENLIAWHPYDEATEVAASVFDEWNDILVEDKPVRLKLETRKEQVAEAARLYGGAAEQAGFLGDALFAYKTWQHVDPKQTELFKKIVEQYRKLHDNENLAQYLQEYLETFPLNGIARFWLAMTELEMGRLRDAKRTALVFSKMSTSMSVDGLYLSFRIAKASGDKAEARKFAEQYARYPQSDADWAKEVDAYLKETAG